MLIGNTWIENAKLRILNGLVTVPPAPAWVTFPQTLQLNLDEEAIIVGFQHLASVCRGVRTELQILYNGTACHEAFVQTSLDNPLAMDILIGNRQPVTMPAPTLDVKPNTLIGLRARLSAGLGCLLYLDLYVVTFYRSEVRELAPMCFPTDQSPMPQV